MKKNFLRFFYLYFFVFVIFGIIFVLTLEIFLNKKIQEEIKNIQRIVLENKKHYLKKDLENIKNVFYFIKDTIYSTNNEELLKFVDIPIKWKINKLFISKDCIYGLVDRKIKYEVNDKYIFANINNQKYLVVLKNNKDKVYIFGINKKFLDNIIVYNFLKYLDNYNKNKISYVAVGKVTNISPEKNNGIFGYIYYMPSKFKNLEGHILSIYKPDAKGNYFRNKYFECYKKNKPCFVTYYFNNPKSGAIEEKISYFNFIKKYKFILLKGIYASQLSNEVNRELSQKVGKIKNIFYTFLAIFFIIYFGFLFFLYFLFMREKKFFIKSLEKEIKERLYFDKLTNLPNRNKLLEDIENAEAIAILDIKEFTSINDIYGFEIGDKILKLISEKLKKKYNNIYRLGSDEFAILFEKKITEDDLRKISNLKVLIYNLTIEFIIGGSNSKKRLLETSELALREAYKSKEHYKLYDEQMLKKQKERIEKLKLLREILKRGDIIPYYQCIVDNNQNIVKYEALMRIKIDNEIKSPYFFMDLIKEARLYTPFSQLMIQKVFDDLKKINKRVSINLSFEDIADEEMKKFILQLINEKNAKKIVFEILESESIKDYDMVKEFIESVKRKGAEIAIDDFGSGYSNFVQVLNLKPSIIKLDASLVKNIKDPKNYKIISFIIEFAKSFNMKTVSEFVENREIFEILKELGVDEYQGYYFCKPQPLENILKKDKISSKKGNDEN